MVRNNCNFIVASVQDLNILANLPNVRASLGVPENMHVDLGHFYERPHSVAFVCDHGGMLFPHLHENAFEVHFMFKPRIPGNVIKACAHDMVREMFTNRSASVIKGSPPRENRAVRHLGYALGFRKIDNSRFTDGLGRVCDIYEKRL